MATVVLIVILATLNVGVGYVLALYIHGTEIAPARPSPPREVVPTVQERSATAASVATAAQGEDTASAESSLPEVDPSCSPQNDDHENAETETQATAVAGVDTQAANEGDADREPTVPSAEPDAAMADAGKQLDDWPEEEQFEKLTQEALGTIKTAATLPKAEEPPPVDADVDKEASPPDSSATAEAASLLDAPLAEDSPEGASVTSDSEPQLAVEEASSPETPDGVGSDATAEDNSLDKAETAPAPEVSDAPFDPQLDEAIAPPPWLGILRAATEPEAFVEAMLQAVRFELGQYRSELMRIDEELRPVELASSSEPLPSEAFESLRHEMLALDRRYLSHQVLVLDAIKEFPEGWGDLTDVVTGVESALASAAEQVKATDRSLESLHSDQPLQHAAGQCRDALAQLMDEVHNVYRAAEQALVALLLCDESQEAERGLMVDGKTMLENRAGLELTLRQWWRDDANRVRSLSLVAVDVDHLREINRQMGIAAGDRIMEIVALQASELLRKNRGFDKAFRIDRRELILFLGDTGPHGAACAAERVRQTIRATRYEHADVAREVTVSCGVTDARPEDTVRTLIDRVLKTVRECKRSGGDHTLIDEGDGPVEIDPPDYRMEPQTVRLFD